MPVSPERLDEVVNLFETMADLQDEAYMSFKKKFLKEARQQLREIEFDCTERRMLHESEARLLKGIRENAESTDVQGFWSKIYQFADIILFRIMDYSLIWRPKEKLHENQAIAIRNLIDKTRLLIARLEDPGVDVDNIEKSLTGIQAEKTKLMKALGIPLETENRLNKVKVLQECRKKKTLLLQLEELEEKTRSSDVEDGMMEGIGEAEDEDEDVASPCDQGDA